MGKSRFLPRPSLFDENREMPELFNYRQLAEHLGIPAEELARLEACVRPQYGSDEMMVELRMIRTLRAIEEGAVTLSEAIAELTHGSVRAS